MYSTYEGIGAECESEPTAREKIIILGGGPNRIGQGIEFDYCCVHAAYALKDAGYETIMVNCNPETVSTDYDTADRLYFEPLTAEDVLEIIRTEQKNGTLKGVIVQFGGQTPLKLARALEAAGVPIIGTSPDSIDLAEDRDRFRTLVDQLGLKQPKSAIGRTTKEIMDQSTGIGFPLLVRPSYVLGGRAMAIMYDEPSLSKYVDELTKMFGDGPILIDSYLQDAIELDVDALSDGTDVFIAGIMQHIEEAGIHSGDSACSLPPYSLDGSLLLAIREQTKALAKALKVIGLMNIQFAVKDGEIYLIEVNPRASRTVPFVAKSIGIPVAKIAARIMAGEKLASFKLGEYKIPTHVCVKEAVFPFARFPGVDVILGPEMKSTGEAMGIDSDFARAFAKSQLSAGSTLPQSGKVFVSVKESDKASVTALVQQLQDIGFTIVATSGTAAHLEKNGLTVKTVNKVREGRPHIVDMLKDNRIALVINTTDGAQSLNDSFSIRRTALLGKIPYYTTMAGARAVAQAIASIKQGQGLDVKSLQAYFK
jgi:carbamoyl-phosphate synthase large subunit